MTHHDDRLSIDNVDDSNFSCCPGSIQISYSDTYFLICFMFFSSTFHRFQGLKLGQATQRCAESQAAIEELKPESLVFNQLPQSKNPTRKFEMEKPQGKCTRKLKMKPFKIFQASSTACKSYSDVGYIPISHLDPSQMLPAVTLT